MCYKYSLSLLLSILLSLTFVSAYADDWCDGFENYPPDSSIDSGWILSGNTSSITDTNVVFSGNQSLKMFGSIGGCWAAVADKALETTFPMKITCAVRNGSENLTGCHQYRAELCLRAGTVWTDPGAIGLFRFLEDGTLEIRSGGTPFDSLHGFNLEQWYEFEINIWVSSDSSIVYTEFWVNGEYVGLYSQEISNLPNLFNASHIDISSQEGTAWFDDICVSNLSVDSLNNLLFPSIIARPCDDECITQPVMVDLSQPITGATIPIRIPVGVDLCDITTDGLLTQDWVLETYINPDDSSERAIGLWNLTGDMIPAGTTTVLNIMFTAERECEASYFMRWDTAFMGDPLHELLFSDSNHFDLQAKFDENRDSVEIVGYEPGNVDNIIGPVSPYDIADLTCMVAHIYRGDTTCMCVLDAADVNGSCTGPNIADVTYLVASLYQGGPEPLCGCLGQDGTYKVSNDIIVRTTYENDVTTIILSSPVELRGLQITLAGDGIPLPVSITDSRLELLSGTKTIGLVDLEGEAVIASGTQKLIQLPGKYEITEAIASDMNHRDVILALNTGTQSTLPTEYSLSQNYPNPFNPVTEIGFSLPKAGNVNLKVYNVMGQLVKTLIAENLEAGTHTVIWDGTDNSGTPVSSGVYFYRLSTDEFVDTKKMVLLK